MVCEEIAFAEAEDLIQEKEDLQKRFDRAIDTKTIRLSFFRKPFKSSRGLSSVDNNDFLGYAIVKFDDLPDGFEQFRVYESVIRSSSHKNNFIKGEQEWTCSVADNSMAIRGYLYAQQNGATNVCAHVALRTVAARFHKDGDMTYGEMNRLPGIKIDHCYRKAGGPNGEGLDQNQMVEVLKAAGAGCIKVEYLDTGPDVESIPPFQKYLYGSIESGYPAIICFGTSGHDYHAIPVFGHTFNEDTWVPSAEIAYFKLGAATQYIPSDSWLSTFIAHDDNLGSNFCIPRDFLYTKNYCDHMAGGPGLCKKREERVVCVIATIPKKVKVSPVSAEAIGAEYLFSMLPQMPAMSGPWQERLAWYARRNRLVLRPILVDGPQYARHLSIITDWDGDPIDHRYVRFLEKELPKENLWLIELSVPELFSANRRKIAEVLIRAEVPANARNAFMIARLPGCFAGKTNQDPSNPEFRFVPSGVKGHVPLFGCEQL